VKSEAEDLTQEVFTKIGQALKAFRGDSQLSTWVYQIATHVALDRIRQRSSARHGDKKSLPVEAIAESEKIKTSGRANRQPPPSSGLSARK